MANEVRLCGVPRRSFGYFPIAGKVTRPAGRNPPAARRRVSERNHRKAAALSAEMAAKSPAKQRPLR